MRTASKILLAAAALAGTGIAASPASARTYVSIGIGAPLYRGYYGYYGYRPAYYPGYYPPAYYGPAVYGGWYGSRHYYGRPWGYYRGGYHGRHWR
ncbi:MAG TPA: hypothetical protein VGC10_08570 [Sphingomonas sp.]